MDFGRGDRAFRTLISVFKRQMKVAFSPLTETTTTTETTTVLTKTKTTTKHSAKTGLFASKSVRERKHLTGQRVDHFFVQLSPLTSVSGGLASPPPPPPPPPTAARVDRRLFRGNIAFGEAPTEAMLPLAVAARLSAPLLSSPSSTSSTSTTMPWTFRNYKRKHTLLTLLFLVSCASFHLSSAQLLFEPNPELTASQPWDRGGNTPQPNGYIRGPSTCYDDRGKAQRCAPQFVNAAFNQLVEATNTCGNPPIEYCRQPGVTGTCFGVGAIMFRRPRA